MPAAQTCPRCGAALLAEAAEGLCPKCLLQEGLEPTAKGARLVSLPEPTPGTRIRYFGDYELLEELGHGGMGVVFKARQVSLNRVVALKLIQGGEFASPKFVQRFRTEAEAAARLQHPHIVAIHEVGEHAGQQYFSMDFVEGPTLEILVRKGPLAPERAARLVQTMATAIHYAHEQGVLHRDLKPSNIIVDVFDQPHITDFGLAKILTGSSALTLGDQPMGSPGYTAPEQAAGKPGDVGTRSDVYALGAVLYQLLTGRAPFHAETLADVLRQVRESDPVAPRVLNPSVDRDLETLCLKCLEKEPPRRYSSAKQLAEELGRFVEGRPILARPVGKPEKLWRWCRRQPVQASLAAALVVIVAVGFGVVTWEWKQAERAQQHAERLLYAADMSLAFRALERNDLGEARRCLTDHWPAAGEPADGGWEWRYLWQQCQGQELLTLDRHAGEGGALAFSPDGRLLAVEGDHGQVNIWDLASTQQVHRLAAPVSVRALAFSPNGSQLAVGWARGLGLWNARTWREEDRIVITNGVRVESVQFSPDGKLLIGANWSGVGIWRMDGDPQQLAPLPGIHHWSHGQHACGISADGKKVAYATVATSRDSAKVILRDLETGECDPVWESGTISAQTLALSPDGRWLAIANNIGPVEIHRLEDIAGPTNSAAEPRILDPMQVSALAFSPDGRRLAAGGENGVIALWETTPWHKLRTFRGHHLWITDLAFSPDPNAALLASTSEDGTVQLWSTVPSERTDLLPIDAIPAGWDPNWETAIYLESDGSYSLKDLSARTPGARYALPYATTNIVTATLGPGATAVAYALTDRSVRLCETGEPGRERARFETPAKVDVLSFSPDGRLLVGWCKLGGMVWVWNVEAGQEREIRSATKTWGRSWYVPQFTADQQQLAIPFDWNHVSLWDFGGSGEALQFEGIHPGIQNVALSSDGKMVATVNINGTVKVWDVASRREIISMEGRGLPMCAVTFSPDGRRVITGSVDEIKVWDVRTGREVANIREDPVGALYLRFEGPDTLMAASLYGLRRLHAPSFAEIEAAEAKGKIGDGRWKMGNGTSGR